MSIRQGKPGGFAGLFIIKVRDDEVTSVRIRDRTSNLGNNVQTLQNVEST